MNRCRASIVTVTAFLFMAGQVFAQASEPAPQSAAEDLKSGSVYVRCDGFPPHRSAAELAGRVLLIMATAGLAGPGERADVGKRLTGAGGVAACDAAVAGESDPIRKVQLIFARSIHHIEAKDYEAALADAHNALAGNAVNDLGFRHSLGLTALELQAAALVRLNRGVEAEAAALEMANDAPYDLITQLHAAPYIQFTAEMTPPKKAFFDRLPRLQPKGFLTKANADERAGDFQGSAADDKAFLDLEYGFLPDQPTKTPEIAILSREAVALALGGDIQQSNALAAATRKTVDDLFASGKALNEQTAIGNSQELLDLQAIIAQLSAGKAAQARLAFAARSRWLAATPAAVAEVTSRLRKGASANELVGPLAIDPATVRANALKEMAGAFANLPDANLYATIRPLISAPEYAHWTRDVWNYQDSPFMVKRTGKETYTGDFIFMKHANGIATGDALLMHLALLAQARGAKGFVLFPHRPRLDSTVVRFGNPGDPGFPPSGTIDAATVIAALSDEFPNPHAPQPNP